MDGRKRLAESDLEPWAKRDLDKAYETRERPRCSREDFADGWIAALIDLRSWSSFIAGKPE